MSIVPSLARTKRKGEREKEREGDRRRFWVPLRRPPGTWLPSPMRRCVLGDPVAPSECLKAHLTGLWKVRGERGQTFEEFDLSLKNDGALRIERDPNHTTHDLLGCTAGLASAGFAVEDVKESHSPFCARKSTYAAAILSSPISTFDSKKVKTSPQLSSLDPQQSNNPVIQ